MKANSITEVKFLCSDEEYHNKSLVRLHQELIILNQHLLDKYLRGPKNQLYPALPLTQKFVQTMVMNVMMMLLLETLQNREMDIIVFVSENDKMQQTIF